MFNYEYFGIEMPQIKLSLEYFALQFQLKLTNIILFAL